MLLFSHIRLAAAVLSPRRARAAVTNILLWVRARNNPTWKRFFDGDEYLLLHPDVARAGLSPLGHFLVYGAEENRNPSPYFDSGEYLRQYPDVAAARVNPLLHYALFGEHESRGLSGQMPVAVPAAAAVTVNNDWLAGTPLVSVVIPCFNYGRFVEQAIRSALNQTFGDFEIVVVEGGSTDGATPQQVRHIESLNLPKTRFYYRREPHLAGDNRNFGIGHARGRYVCCLDADDLLAPVYLETAVFLAEVFGYDLVSPSLQSFGDSDTRWVVADPAFPQIAQENQVATAALFRRSAWAHVGGYRDLGSGDSYVYEDWDFWIRLLGHGFVGKAIRDPLLLYRVHGGGLSTSGRASYGHHQQRLMQLNARLLEDPIDSPSPRRVVRPYSNLGELESDEPGFLVALPFVTIGGAEKLIRTMACHLVKRGRRVIVTTTLTLREDIPDDLSSFEAITPHLYRLDRLFDNDGARREFLRYLIRRYGVTTLMVAGCEFVYRSLPEIAPEFPGMRVIDQLFNDSVHVPSNRRFADYIDATVVPSEFLANTLIDKHGADPSSVHVIPHGVEVAASGDYNPGPSGLPEAARGKTVIGFFGRLSPEKGPDIFVEIARGLAHRRDLYFVMTGDGPERPELLRRIRRYDLDARFCAPGFVKDVAPLMRAADIVVLPSRQDGMPLAVLEAQALGKPVVASRVGSLPAMVFEGESGFLCRSEAVDSFCERIARLAGDPELRARMGAAGRAAVLARHGAEKMVEAYEEVFRGLARSATGVRT